MAVFRVGRVVKGWVRLTGTAPTKMIHIKKNKGEDRTQGAFIEVPLDWRKTLGGKAGGQQNSP
jgi:hypothetical protein